MRHHVQFLDGFFSLGGALRMKKSQFFPSRLGIVLKAPDVMLLQRRRDVAPLDFDKVDTILQLMFYCKNALVLIKNTNTNIHS